MTRKMAFHSNKHARQPNLNELLPIIGQPGVELAENSWRSTEHEDSCTLEEVERQREKVYSYGGYAIFDSGYDSFDDPMDLRNRHAVHIVGESQAYNPMRFGTSWVVEFDDGYTGVAYFDELFEIEPKDSMDYFGKSLMFDMRGAIYSIASKIANGDIDEADKKKVINNEFYKLYDSKQKLFEETVDKVAGDLKKDRIVEWSEFKSISEYDCELFKKASEKAKQELYGNDKK